MSETVVFTLNPFSILRDYPPFVRSGDVFQALKVMYETGQAERVERFDDGVAIRFTFYLTAHQTPAEFMTRFHAIRRAVTLVRRQAAGLPDIWEPTERKGAAE